LINIVVKYHSDKVAQEVHRLMHKNMPIKLPNQKTETGLSAQNKDIESKIKKDNAAFGGNNLLHKN